MGNKDIRVMSAGFESHQSYALRFDFALFVFDQ